MIRYIRKIEICPARHIRAAHPLPDGLSVHLPEWAPWRELPVVGLASLQVEEELISGVRIYTAKISASLPERFVPVQHAALRLTDVRGRQLLVGLSERPYPLLTQEDALPDKPTEASRTQLNATWTAPRPPLAIV